MAIGGLNRDLNLYLWLVTAYQHRAGTSLHAVARPDKTARTGDGAVIQGHRPYSAIAHSFQNVGIHVVTVAGTAGELPVTQKVKVVVQE